MPEATQVVHHGGTLRLLGSVEFDHLDTASGYLTQTWALTRNFARTLLNIRGGRVFDEAIELHPDVAAELPTRGNGGISADGRTYTIRLRPGVRWNTQPPRDVTAADFVRGLKRLGNPAQPSGGLAYFRETVEGLAEFYAGYARLDPTDPATLAHYQNTTEVSGLRAVDDRTLVVTLRRPASDFLRLLSMQFAAAAPAEYDRFLPDSESFRRSVLSNGPYQVDLWEPAKRLVLTRNPVWNAATDPIRGQYVDRIELDFTASSPLGVQEAIEAGTADLSWDQRVPTARLPELLGSGSTDLIVAPEAMASPYLVFNVVSPNNGGALQDVRVRRALQYAIDKAALADLYGGSAIASPLHQIIPPGGFGHQAYAAYQTSGDRGDPDLARTLLAEAGYGDGLHLVFPYRTTSSYPQVAEVIADNLNKCGVTVDLARDVDGSLYGPMLHSPAAARGGQWDIATPGWVPDWYGNNGRSSIVPLFDGRSLGTNSPNVGLYGNRAVDVLIDRALAATDGDEAAAAWHEVDRQIMADAPIIPLLCQRYPIFKAARVRNARYLPAVQSFEYSQVWLAPPDGSRGA